MSTHEEFAVTVKDIKKTFRIPLDKSSGIKQLILNFYKRKKSYRVFKALNGVSFEVRKGEFFGIVGRNGSGKSTLLKILAGVYVPDIGDVKVNGSLTPFIELGVGFNPELSGRENVFLNGALLGFSRKEMETMYDEIVDFAELHDFMEERLKNYSSGMQVRLAFSIAIRANTDILILDEVLAVGDSAFQQKCADYFEEIKNTDKTIILVTHSMADVEKYCSRALLLEEGVIKSIGLPDKISQQYAIGNLTSDPKDTNSVDNLNYPVKKLSIKLDSTKGLTSQDTLKFSVDYELEEEYPIEVGIAIISKGVHVVEQNTKDVRLHYTPHKKHSLKFQYSLDQLNPGRYELAVAIFEKKSFKLVGYNSHNPDFMILNQDGLQGGLLSRRGEWIVKN